MNLRRKNIYLEKLFELETETETESNIPTTEINDYIEEKIVGGAGEVIYGTIIFEETSPDGTTPNGTTSDGTPHVGEITREDKIKIYTKLIKSITDFSKKWKKEEKTIFSCGRNTIDEDGINIDIENKFLKYETLTS